MANEQLAEEFGSLGYVGYAYLGKPLSRKPDEILLDALTYSNLEPRLVEALPWLVQEYWHYLPKVADEVRRFDCQNKLGFLVDLARRVSQNPQRAAALKSMEGLLEEIRLNRDLFLSDDKART